MPKLVIQKVQVKKYSKIKYKKMKRQHLIGTGDIILLFVLCRVSLKF